MCEQVRFTPAKAAYPFHSAGHAGSKLLVLPYRPVGSLDAFDVIAAHRSALNNSNRDALNNYCRSRNKPLIFFSGGITSSIYKDSEIPFLYLNSKEFYSVNLKIFLEHLNFCTTPNLLILQFGTQWKMSLLLALRNRIVVAQSKSFMIAEGSDIQIVELIRRVQDLQISDLIKKDLVTDQTRELLSGSPTASVTNQNLIEIRAIIDHQIISMI